MISFSVVIPLYNKELSIASTIDSVLSQTYRSFELIIVNDGSTDYSLNVAESFNDDRIFIINKPNGGVCSARNKGISETRFDYVAFLDADDIWDIHYLEEQSKMIELFPDAAMWGFNWVERTHEKDIYLETGLPKDFVGYVKNYWTLMRVSDLFSSSSLVIYKAAFAKVGFFDERIKYSEDLDMWYRIILNYPVVFNSTPMVIYNQEAENRALKRKVKLKDFLPFYVDKYEKYCRQNKNFAHFIHTFAASALVPYYFGDVNERKEADETVSKLRFEDIHYKYRLLFRTPRFIGNIFLQLIEYRHRIKE